MRRSGNAYCTGTEERRPGERGKLQRRPNRHAQRRGGRAACKLSRDLRGYPQPTNGSVKLKKRVRTVPVPGWVPLHMETWGLLFIPALGGAVAVAVGGGGRGGHGDGKWASGRLGSFRK
jgi:hypothetical protein